MKMSDLYIGQDCNMYRVFLPTGIEVARIVMPPDNQCSNGSKCYIECIRY